MGRVKRSNALSWIFMRYVLVMLGSLVGLVIVAYLLLYLLISVGCIYPANYAEQKINEAYDTILRADKVTAEMIPALCDYVIFSENGEKIGGDLSEQYEQIAWNVAKYGNASGSTFCLYIAINLCVIRKKFVSFRTSCNRTAYCKFSSACNITFYCTK